METYAQNQQAMSYVVILEYLSCTFLEHIKIEAFNFVSISFNKEQKSFPLI